MDDRRWTCHAQDHPGAVDAGLVAPDQTVAPVRTPACTEQVEHALPLLGALVDRLDILEGQADAQGTALLAVLVLPLPDNLSDHLVLLVAIIVVFP
jgi:hypothetical protein